MGGCTVAACQYVHGTDMNRAPRSMCCRSRSVHVPHDHRRPGNPTANRGCIELRERAMQKTELEIDEPVGEMDCDESRRRRFGSDGEIRSRWG